MKNTVIGIFTDDYIDRFIYEKVFQKYEHKVEYHVFANPEAGLTFANTNQLDVVFIEMHFWGENFGGISILNQLKKITDKSILAIAMTSLLQQGDLDHILASGFSMCFEKPVNLEALELFAERRNN
jgi:CheY-like chemotaxis protein